MKKLKIDTYKLTILKFTYQYFLHMLFEFSCLDIRVYLLKHNLQKYEELRVAHVTSKSGRKLAIHDVFRKRLRG